MAKTRYSYGVPSTRLGSESEYVVASRTRKFPPNAPPGARRSTLKSVAIAEALVQERLICLMPTGVATKFTGAAGKTVALDSFEASSEGTSPSSARIECDALPQARRIRRAGRASGGKIRLDGYRHGLAVLRCALDLKRDIAGPGIGVGPRQRHRMIIERYRGQILRAEGGDWSTARHNPSMHCVPIGQSESSAHRPGACAVHPANPKSSTSGMRIAGTPRMRMSQSMGIRMQTVAGRRRVFRDANGPHHHKSDEFPPPHGTPQGQGSRPNYNTAHRSKKVTYVR
jgi:hypothetical protein